MSSLQYFFLFEEYFKLQNFKYCICCNTEKQRAKWFTAKPNLEVGDLVLLEKDLIKRSSWPVARVVNVHKNPQDQLVRTIEVKVASMGDEESPVLERSVLNIFPLECTRLLREDQQ